jgi:putative addiction module antidote
MKNRGLVNTASSKSGIFPSSGLDTDGCYNDCYPMPIETKVRRIGNSLGIVLPKEALLALKVEEGDTLYLTESPQCALRITPHKPGFEEKMKIADSLMSRYRNAFQELAK